MNALANALFEAEERQRQELWRHWARMPLVDLHEAAALLSGIIPSEKWNHETISRKRASFGEELNEKYLRTFALLVRAEAAFILHDRNSLDEVVAWARENGIPISEKLANAIEEIKFYKYTVQRESEFDAPKEEPADTPLGTRERDTLLYLIAAMALEKYAYNPNKRNNAVSQIGDDLEKIGVDRLSDETIRNKLKEASELVPQAIFNKALGER